MPTRKVPSTGGRRRRARWVLVLAAAGISTAWAFASYDLGAQRSDGVQVVSSNSSTTGLPANRGTGTSLASGTASADASMSPQVAGEPAIDPMTTVSATDMSGYFEDPVAVRLAPSAGNSRIVFSGTTKATMTCAYPLSPRCFTWTRLTMDAGSLASQIQAAGDTITNFQNLNAFQADDGTWHAVLAIGVQSAAQPDHWTVLVHAHPAGGGGGGAMPLAWSADTVLSGSFSTRVDGNYDGKYFQNGSQLYLLYVKNFAPKPALRNGIVLQAMVSPTQLASSPLVTLLNTDSRFGPMVSENYANTQAKLVEAPYLTMIGGKWALFYATGAYRDVGYKTGVAWSDTLIPVDANTRYRKVLQQDAAGVWGQAGAWEVRYLFQSQISQWPNYTANTMFSPGVASVMLSPTSIWNAFFAGFDPNDRAFISPGVSDPTHRRPYFAHLNVAIPQGQTVTNATDAQLAGWLSPQVR
jgi:hypothetical protein